MTTLSHLSTWSSPRLADGKAVTHKCSLPAKRNDAPSPALLVSSVTDRDAIVTRGTTQTSTRGNHAPPYVNLGTQGSTSTGLHRNRHVDPHSCAPGCPVRPVCFEVAEGGGMECLACGSCVNARPVFHFLQSLCRDALPTNVETFIHSRNQKVWKSKRLGSEYSRRGVHTRNRRADLACATRRRGSSARRRRGQPSCDHARRDVRHAPTWALAGDGGSWRWGNLKGKRVNASVRSSDRPAPGSPRFGSGTSSIQIRGRVLRDPSIIRSRHKDDAVRLLSSTRKKKRDEMWRMPFVELVLSSDDFSVGRLD